MESIRGHDSSDARIHADVHATTAIAPVVQQLRRHPIAAADTPAERQAAAFASGAGRPAIARTTTNTGTNPAPTDPTPAPGSHGRPLEPHVRQPHEQALGVDLSRVRIHDDIVAHLLARSLGTRAATLGRRIYFGESYYAPETDAGRALLAHELVHTMQAEARTMVHRQVRPTSSAQHTAGATFARLRALQEVVNSRAHALARDHLVNKVGQREGGAGQLERALERRDARVTRENPGARISSSSGMHDALGAEYPVPHPAQGNLTVAVGIAIDDTGKLIHLVATSKGTDAAEIRKMLSDEIFVDPPNDMPKGKRIRDPRFDAEQILIRGAKERNLRLITIGASTDVCSDCAKAIADAKITRATELSKRIKTQATTDPAYENALELVEEALRASLEPGQKGPLVEHISTLPRPQPEGAAAQEPKAAVPKPKPGDEAKSRGTNTRERPVPEVVPPSGAPPTTAGARQEGLNQIGEFHWAVGGAVEGAGMQSLGAMQSVIIGNELERMEKDIAEARAKAEKFREDGYYVALFVAVEVPKGVDLFAHVFTETRDLPKYHAVSLKHGEDAASVAVLGPAVGAAPLEGHKIETFQILRPAEQAPIVPFGHHRVQLPGTFINSERMLVMELAVSAGKVQADIFGPARRLKVLEATLKVPDFGRLWQGPLDPHITIRYVDDQRRVVCSTLRFATDGFTEEVAIGNRRSTSSFWRQLN